MTERVEIGSIALKTVILMLTTELMTELTALINGDRCQTEVELVSVLGVTRQVISKRLHALEMIQKQGILVPYELKPRDLKRHFFACEQLLQQQKRRRFFIVL